MTGRPDRPGSRGGPAGETRARIEALGRESPEWRPLLALLEETLLASEDPAWDAVVEGAAARREGDLPLLAGLVLAVPADLVGGWVARLLGIAAVGTETMRAVAIDHRGALALVEAAVGQDEARVAAVATDLGADPRPVGAVAALAAMPLLQALGRRAGGAPSSWPHGYCHVCGAWPALAELRGLEQAKRLRCARCGADWRTAWLRCVFCGETDHRRLGALVPDAGGESRRVDTCETCLGYLKAQATLTAWPPGTVILEDLATVALDVAALERGYARPEQPGHRLGVRLVAGGRT